MTPPTTEPTHDARAETERIRALQPEQVPVEGGKAKQPLPLWQANFITSVGMILPVRLRVWFTFGVNFVFNNIRAVFAYVGATLGQWVFGGMVFLAYHLVVGPTSLLARLFGDDAMSTKPKEGSYFTKKEPPDTTEERFLRQF